MLDIIFRIRNEIACKVKAILMSNAHFHKHQLKIVVLLSFRKFLLLLDER